jgi:gliding motility-associated-like protein
MWSNAGGLVSIKDEAMLSVHGNVLNQANGRFHNSDTIYITGNWTNDGGNEAFISLGEGLVIMHGDTQRINGQDITRFYELRTRGTGVKYGDLDVYVDGYLRLFDREFNLDTNVVYVFNTDTSSVTTGFNNTFGFVSALEDGGLQRYMASALDYRFPVGSSQGTPRFRPLDIQPESSAINAFRVRMANVDATTESFNRGSRQILLCEVNPEYYHRIYHRQGNDSINIRYYFDQANEQSFDEITHYVNSFRWERIVLSSLGFSNLYNLDYRQTNQVVGGFTTPAFALATISDSLTITPDHNPICAGDSVVFSLPSGYTLYDYFWNGTMVQSGPDSIMTFYGIQDGDTITARALNADCIAYAIPLIIEYFEHPVVLTANDTAICSYESVLFTASPGFINYEFFVNGQSVQNGPAAAYTASNLLNGTTVWVMATDTNCTFLSNTVNIFVYSNPISLTTTDTSLCPGQVATFVANTGYLNYTFQVNGITVYNGPNRIWSSSDFDNGDIVTVIGQDSFCNYTSNAINLFVFERPLNLQATPQPACAGAPITFNATGGFFNYNFYVNGQSVQSSFDSIFVSSSLVQGDQVTVIGTDAWCNYNGDTLTVQLFQNTLSLSANQSIVCPGAPVTFTASNGYNNYAFYQNGQLVQNGSNNTWTGQFYNANDSVVVLATDANCTYASNAILMQVYSNFVSLSSTPSSSCAADTITFSASAGFNNYDFYLNGSLVQSGLADTWQTNTAQQGDLVWVAATDANCTYYDTLSVQIYSNSLVLESNGTSFCTGELLSLLANPGFVNYTFNVNGVAVQDGSSNAFLSNTFSANTYNIWVEAFDGFCDYVSDTLNITVYASPNLVAYGDTVLVAGQQHTIGATGADFYSWTPSTGLACSICPSTTLSVMDNTVFVVTGESVNGCISTDSVFISIEKQEGEPPFLIPTAITPNADGRNDNWILDGIQIFENHEVIVINRWGDEVFRSNDYNNQFDGYYKNGRLPAGTYYYIIRLSSSRVYKGPITIIWE